MTVPDKESFSISQIKSSGMFRIMWISGRAHGHQFLAKVPHKRSGNEVGVITLLKLIIWGTHEPEYIYSSIHGVETFRNTTLENKQVMRDIVLSLTSGVLDPFVAIHEDDLWMAEALRGTLQPATVAAIVDFYPRLTDWRAKDMAVHMLQDISREQVRQVMTDALNSPIVYSRAIAMCRLANDFSSFMDIVRLLLKAGLDQ